MGNSLPTLSGDQTLTLTKLLRENYENYKNASMNDIEIQERLTTDYRLFILSLNDAKDKINETQNHAKNTSTPTSKRAGTRRRSFDNKNLSRGHVDISLPSFEAIVLLTPAIVPDSATVIPNIDTWESVDQQPYCVVCAMAFKTPAFLARHVKYSDQHKNNAQSILESKVNTSTETEFKQEIIEKSQTSQKQLQIEGIDYKLLYGGSKFFWISKEDIDFSIYLHCKISVIEIIPFHLQKCKELGRIYLDLDIITKFLKNTADSRENPSDNDIVRYILSRLQLSDTSVAPFNDQEQQLVQFGDYSIKSEFDDESTKAMVIKKPPMNHTPIIVTRRRSTADEELSEVLSISSKEKTNATSAVNTVDIIQDQT